jgi:hypothetical protein
LTLSTRTTLSAHTRRYGAFRRSGVAWVVALTAAASLANTAQAADGFVSTKPPPRAEHWQGFATWLDLYPSFVDAHFAMPRCV